MQIQNFIVLILFLVSAKAFAIGNVQTFPTKNECLNSFISLTGNKDAVAGENYCKDKVVVVKSDIDRCADDKLLDHKKRTSISAAEEPRLLQKYKNECLQAAQQQQQNLQQQGQLDVYAAQLPKPQGSAQPGSATQQGAVPSNSAAFISLVRSAGQAARELIKDDEKKSEEKKPVEKPVAEEKPAAEKPAATEKPAEKSVAEETSTTPYVDPLAKIKDDKSEVCFNNECAAKKEFLDSNAMSDDYRAAHPDKPDTPEKQEKDKQEAKASGTVAAAAVPALANNIEDTNTVADAANLPVPKSPIIEASETTSGTLTSGVNTIVAALNGVGSSGTGELTFRDTMGIVPFYKTIAALESIQADIGKYATTTKVVCAESANTTEFLCMDGPGAKATKKLMTAAGPVLAAFNSAQTACSSTAKVTRFASAALTVAKGVCVGAQFLCDGKCATAVADLNKTITTLPGLIKTAVAADKNIAMHACLDYVESTGGTGAASPECKAEYERKSTVALAAIPKLMGFLNNENAVKIPGTSPALVAGCAAKAADIALLVTDIAGLVAAQKSANECDKKLAADGGSGKTIAQYCDKSENSSTPFCKCQKNAQQEGCPGYVASANKTDKPAEVAGLFLQNNGGLSSFAGSGPKGQLDPSKTISDSKNSNDPSADPNSLSLPDGSPSSPSGAVGSSPGSSGTRGSGSDANNKDDQAAKKKEWSFGAFASKLGGMFGGAKSSKASSGNGALNAKQEAAIKRKLASDKLAGEITSASGKSNWEKVRQAYLIKETSLLGQ